MALLKNKDYTLDLGSVVPVEHERVKTSVFIRHITRSSATGTALPGLLSKSEMKGFATSHITQHDAFHF